MTFFLVSQFLQRIKKQNRYKENRRLKNNEGMTNIKQYTKKKQYRAAKKHLNSNIKYPDFTWTDVGSEEYLNAIDDINDLYRKMLEIGKAAEVFHDKECPMMSAKTKQEFQKHRDSMRRNY